MGIIVNSPVLIKRKYFTLDEFMNTHPRIDITPHESVLVKSCQTIQESTFIDYLLCGVKIKFIVGIDYSESMIPYIKSPNSIVLKILKELTPLLLEYASSKSINIYTFANEPVNAPFYLLGESNDVEDNASKSTDITNISKSTDFTIQKKSVQFDSNMKNPKATMEVKAEKKLNKSQDISESKSSQFTSSVVPNINTIEKMMREYNRCLSTIKHGAPTLLAPLLGHIRESMCEQYSLM